MNLQKLFTMQAKLDADITTKHPVAEGENRLEKKVLALLVELGECANEWRGFKFWSNRQEPNVFEREHCPDCFEKGYYRGNPPKDEKKGVHGLGNHWYHCEKCSGYLVVDKNPLLEEYVDCLHFVLSIGNSIEFDYTKGIAKSLHFTPYHDVATEEMLLYAFGRVIAFKGGVMSDDSLRIFYAHMLQSILTLGATLGFTWDQIEQAYYDKNKINFERQKNGY